MEGVIETPCLVCGATTRTGLHYGAITCYPCRAFFRLLALAFDWCFLSSFKRSRVNHPSICSTTTRTLKIAFFTLPSQSFEKNLTKRWWPRTGKYEHREAAFPKKRVGKRSQYMGTRLEYHQNLAGTFITMFCCCVSMWTSFSWMSVWFCVYL